MVAERIAELEMIKVFRNNALSARTLLARGEIDTRQAIILTQIGAANAFYKESAQWEINRQQLKSILTIVRGVGDKTAEALIAEFGTLEAIVTATSEQLQVVKGIGKVKSVRFSKEFKKLRKNTERR